MLLNGGHNCGVAVPKVCGPLSANAIDIHVVSVVPHPRASAAHDCERTLGIHAAGVRSLESLPMAGADIGRGES